MLALPEGMQIGFGGEWAGLLVLVVGYWLYRAEPRPGVNGDTPDLLAEGDAPQRHVPFSRASAERWIAVTDLLLE